jgi:large subunit ribosomal protein L13
MRETQGDPEEEIQNHSRSVRRAASTGGFPPDSVRFRGLEEAGFSIEFPRISRLTPRNRLPSLRPPSHTPVCPEPFYNKHMKTFSAKPHEVERKWYVIDAKGKVLGQVAVEAARLLRGKHKPIFTSHVDTGDFVVVINADQVVLTGAKENAKIYTRFSGYVGGKKVETPRIVRERRPILLVERAVYGMLPKTRLGKAQFQTQGLCRRRAPARSPATRRIRRPLIHHPTRFSPHDRHHHQ